jgi:hypothetical protein
MCHGHTKVSSIVVPAPELRGELPFLFYFQPRVQPGTNVHVLLVVCGTNAFLLARKPDQR